MLGRILGGLRTRMGGQVKEDAAVVSRRWVEEGIARNAAGALADAAICFERALAADPASIPAMHGRAAMHHLAGEQEEAIALCDEVLERAPGHIDAWITRAFAARAIGDLEAALDGFRHAVEIEPRSGLISCVGGIFFQQGRIDDAIRQMDHAIAIDPENDVVQSNRLFILNHDSTRTRKEIAQAHFDWGHAVEVRTAGMRSTHPPGGVAEKRLKEEQHLKDKRAEEEQRVEEEMYMQKALLAHAASVANATRAKAAANAAAMASTFESDSSMDAEPTDVASRLLTSLKAPILKSSMKKLGKKVPRAKTVSLKKASISSPKKASSPSNLMTPSKQPKLKDPPVPSTLTSSALIPSFSAPVNLLPSVPMAPMSEAAPSLGVGSTNVATPKDIDAFWEAMHQTSATPPSSES